MLHTSDFDHFEKSSSLLLETNNRMAENNATMSAIEKRKPAKTRKMLKRTFWIQVPLNREPVM